MRPCPEAGAAQVPLLWREGTRRLVRRQRKLCGAMPLMQLPGPERGRPLPKVRHHHDGSCMSIMQKILPFQGLDHRGWAGLAERQFLSSKHIIENERLVLCFGQGVKCDGYN